MDGDELLVSGTRWREYIDCLDRTLANWHAENPGEPGIGPAALQAIVRAEVPPQMFKAVLTDRIKSGRVVLKDQLVRAASHKPAVSPQVQKQWQQLESYLQSRGLNPALRSEIADETGMDVARLEAIARAALKAGKLLAIGEKRLALPDTIRQLADKLGRHHGDPDGVTVVEAKQVFGLGRNVTIEILEFLDGIGYTRRNGNQRVIADSGALERRLGR